MIPQSMGFRVEEIALRDVIMLEVRVILVFSGWEYKKKVPQALLIRGHRRCAIIA
jgi:hypothetical protein